MSQIKDYVLLLVGSCLVCGGLTILAPNGQFERVIRLVGSIFLLLCLLLPIKNTWSHLYRNRHDIVDVPSTYSEQQSWEYAVDAMRETMRQEIDGYVVTVTGRHAYKIDIDMKVENKTFALNRIVITLFPDDMIKASAVADYVAIKIGVRPQVISHSTGE